MEPTPVLASLQDNRCDLSADRFIPAPISYRGDICGITSGISVGARCKLSYFRNDFFCSLRLTIQNLSHDFQMSVAEQWNEPLRTGSDRYGLIYKAIQPYWLIRNYLAGDRDVAELVFPNKEALRHSSFGGACCKLGWKFVVNILHLNCPRLRQISKTGGANSKLCVNVLSNITRIKNLCVGVIIKGRCCSCGEEKCIGRQETYFTVPIICNTSVQLATIYSNDDVVRRYKREKIRAMKDTFRAGGIQRHCYDEIDCDQMLRCEFCKIYTQLK